MGPVSTNQNLRNLPSRNGTGFIETTAPGHRAGGGDPVDLQARSSVRANGRSDPPRSRSQERPPGLNYPHARLKRPCATLTGIRVFARLKTRSLTSLPGFQAACRFGCGSGQPIFLSPPPLDPHWTPTPSPAPPPPHCQTARRDSLAALAAAKGGTQKLFERAQDVVFANGCTRRRFSRV